MLPPQYDQDEAVLTQSETKVSKPPLYKVLLHNDDFTTMEFVVYILETVFGHPEDKAMQIMLQVHTRGIGVAGTYPYEVAEMKVAKTTALARASEFPLLCTMEEA
jgi:ATP-dependent Clp protease adaptor protein ClpS